MHKQLSAPLTQDQAYRLADAVMEHEGLALSASAHEDESTGTWVFEATCEAEPDLAVFEALARSVLGGAVSFAVQPVDLQADWVGKSLEGLAPVRAGGFYVHGSHDADTVPAGARPIQIDAAQAFGTGHHETTTGCLEALEIVLRTHRPVRPIDLGTGTGILAIAAAMRLRVPVLATDIDPVAVRTTRANARLNRVSSFILPVRADGLAHRDIRDNAPYDLILANILAGPLITLAPGIGTIAGPGAMIILSGLLDTQVRRVRSAYRRADMVVTRHLSRNGWATLILEKR